MNTAITILLVIIAITGIVNSYLSLKNIKLKKKVLIRQPSQKSNNGNILINIELDPEVEHYKEFISSRIMPSKDQQQKKEALEPTA